MAIRCGQVCSVVLLVVGGCIVIVLFLVVLFDDGVVVVDDFAGGDFNGGVDVVAVVNLACGDFAL